MRGELQTIKLASLFKYFTKKIDLRRSISDYAFILNINTKRLMMKAIFFDIDGTLVSFKTHQIPESTINAIRLAKENGHKIFIATGRPKAIINNLGKIEEYVDGYVTMNGGYCFTTDQVLHKSIIPKNDVENMAKYCIDNKKAVIFVSEHTISVCQPNKLVKDIFYDHLNVPVIPEKTFEEAISGDVFQMTPFITKEEENSILNLIPNCQPERWNPEFVDIVSKGNTKETGVEVIRKHFNLKLEDTVAIGDGGNDISMLAHAGIGIAMGNAVDHVKSYADYVTSTVDEDGIWNALKHFNII